jgi:hypothetical protein
VQLTQLVSMFAFFSIVNGGSILPASMNWPERPILEAARE